jgi:DNA processing protein
METINLDELKNTSLKNKPIYYKGNLELLKRKKVSIVGSRKPNKYAKELTAYLAKELSNRGVCIVSGGAMGVDAIAHKNEGTNKTIMVSATGLDKRYPAINKNLIADIEKNALVLSQFSKNTPSFAYNFPLRNELIVALGEVLIVTYADLNSGSMRSVEYAIKQNKEIYVLPHRLNESEATNQLLATNKAKAIYDIEKFLDMFGKKEEVVFDEFLEFCKTNPIYDEVVLKYGDKVFEYELLGKIEIKQGKIFVL